MVLPPSLEALARAWGRACVAFPAWPVPAELPDDDQRLAAVLDAAPRAAVELMRAAVEPGDAMPYVEPPRRQADIIGWMRAQPLVLRLGNLAPFRPEARACAAAWRERLAELFGGRAARRADVRVDLYLSAPGARTRFHADPSHNVVYQLRGRRELHAFSPQDARLIDAATRPKVFLLRGEHPRYRAECEPDAARLELSPGRAAYLPILGGHWVDGGAELSVSYTVSLRTPEVLVEKRCHELNWRLERRGYRPAAFGLHPFRDRLKAGLETALHHALPIRPRRPNQDVTWDRDVSAR